MRVLIAVDGSEAALEAIDQIVPLLNEDRDEVAFYCSPPRVRLRSKGSARELVADAEESFAKSIFKRANDRLRVKFEEDADTIPGHQDARRGVIIAAQQWRADLIVVGARGLNVFERLLLGSVSLAVVHNSDIPVWVARPPQKTQSDHWRVLLASESPATAAAPANLLGRFCWRDNASFTVMTVIPSLFGGHVPDWLQQEARSPDVEELVHRWASEHDSEMQETATQMKAFVKTLPAPLSCAQTVIADGEPTAAILNAASNGAHNLIVIGSRRKWSPGSAILGRVSEAVLNHAECSVLIVPHPESP